MFDLLCKIFYGRFHVNIILRQTKKNCIQVHYFDPLVFMAALCYSGTVVLKLKYLY